MTDRKAIRRTVATMAAMIALGAGATANTGAAAYAETGTATARCGRAVVTAASVQVWIDPEATGDMWGIWVQGDLVCIYGTNASETRYRVQWYCVPSRCDPAGYRDGWVTTDPQSIGDKSGCLGAGVAGSSVKVYMDPTGTFEHWGHWPRGTFFCTYGTNATGTRYRVLWDCIAGDQCDEEPRLRDGWVTSNPRYIWVE